MTREVRTEIMIDAPRHQVWETLTHFEAYPSWNPFAKSVQGPLMIGKKLSVTIEIPNQGAMKFKPVVRDVQEQTRFAWLGRFLVKGLFDGEHIFELEAISDQQCRLVQREVFGGILAAMMWKKLSVNTRQGFELMNQALKSRCEAMATR